MSDVSDPGERLIEIESKISFQERTIEVLNEVVTEQQNLIDRLTVRIDRMAARIDRITDSFADGSGSSAEDVA